MLEMRKFFTTLVLRPYHHSLTYGMSKAGIFDIGFGEILLSPLLQWAEKHQFQPDSRKPGVADPNLIYETEISRLGIHRVRVSVFGSKSCVFLAVCGQIWQKNYDLRSS